MSKLAKLFVSIAFCVGLLVVFGVAYIGSSITRGFYYISEKPDFILLVRNYVLGSVVDDFILLSFFGSLFSLVVLFKTRRYIIFQIPLLVISLLFSILIMQSISPMNKEFQELFAIIQNTSSGNTLYKFKFTSGLYRSTNVSYKPNQSCEELKNYYSKKFAEENVYISKTFEEGNGLNECYWTQGLPKFNNFTIDTNNNFVDIERPY